MQPQTPPSQPVNGQDPYGFIMNSSVPAAGRGSQKPSSTRSRIVIAAIVGVVLVMVGGAIFTAILGSGPNTSENLTQIVYKQAEIIRVANIGTQKARSSTAQNFAHTTKLSVISDELSTIAYLKSTGVEIKTQDLESRKNPPNDAILTKADQAGNFDEAMTALLKKELTSYQTSLTETFKIVTEAKGKKVVTDNYNHVGALLKQ